jgi:hypothetical protein
MTVRLAGCAFMKGINLLNPCQKAVVGMVSFSGTKRSGQAISAKSVDGLGSGSSAARRFDALLVFQVEFAEVRPLVQAPECGLWFRLSRCFLTFSLPMRPQVQVASPRRKEERPASHQAGWQQGAWRRRKFLRQLAELTHQPS